MDEPGNDEPGSEDLLAAYRERKRKAILEAQASTGQPASTPQLTAAPMARPAAATFAPPVAQPMPAPLPPPPMPPRAISPVAVHTQIPAPGSSLDRVPASAPSALALAPSPTQLAATGPLKLSEALLADKAITVRGSPVGKAMGLAISLFGLSLLAYDRRSVFMLEEATTFAGLSVFLMAVGLVVLGAALALVFSLVPARRRLVVRLAESQAEEWRRIQAQTKRLTVQVRAGLVAAILGLVLAAAAYTVGPAGIVATLPAVGGGMAAVGLAVMCFASARRSLARRLYVQTLVLSGLERTGVGASDTRVAPVLLALDELLGALPADQVQQFLASPQAQAYLDLIDEAGRSHGK